jgi:hypothetical protein
MFESCRDRQPKTRKKSNKYGHFFDVRASFLRALRGFRADSVCSVWYVVLQGVTRGDGCSMQHGPRQPVRRSSCFRTHAIRCSEEACIKLKRPTYPTVVGTAGYFFIQAGHRETAIEHAIQVIGEHAAQARESFARDPVMAELEAPMETWVIESLIQGAWPREYHEWEKATKGYFEGQHKRSGSSKPDWKAIFALMQSPAVD